VTNPAVVHTYIQSRFYRSPEVVLGLPYTTSIDIWSFACIVAELVTGFPLFAANNEVDLMGSIIQVIGPPPKAFIQSASRVKQFFGTPYSQKKIKKAHWSPLERRKPRAKTKLRLERQPAHAQQSTTVFCPQS